MFQKNTLSVKNLTLGLRVKVNPGLKLAEKSHMGNAVKAVNYEQLEKEKVQQLQANIQSRLAAQSLGKIDSLRHTVLSSIVRGDYDKACEDLDRYVLLKADFPTFKHRTEAHIQHCKELVNAIRAKRNFPGLTAMTMSKQQEMLDHVLAHFEELKHVVKHIERIAKDCALEDVRSTAWLLKIISYVVIAVVGVAFMLDFTKSLGRPLMVVYNDFSETLWQLIARTFGL